jgi:hypothetical protein
MVGDGGNTAGSSELAAIMTPLRARIVENVVGI